MSTLWGAGDFDVLGVTLIRPRPLYRTFVPLSPGLSVLYGRNGAGKTRVLEGLHAAVTGFQGRAWAWLHVRLRDVETGADGLVRQLNGMLGANLFTSPSEHSYTDLRQRIESALAEQWEAELEDVETYARELARSGVLSLIPVGAGGGHQWRVYLSGLPGDDTPLLARRARRYREAWQAALTLSTEEERQSALNDANDAFVLDVEGDVDEDEPVPFQDPEQPELLVELGTLTLTTPLCDVYGPPSGDLAGQTIDKLLHRTGSRRPLLIPGTDELQQYVVEDIAHLSGRASDSARWS